jgi:hypothetical protein
VKQAADSYTLDLLDKPKRGRPRKPNALTPAERARRYRARKRDDGREPFEPAIDRPLTDDEVMMMNPDQLRAITGNTIDDCRAWIAQARGKWIRANNWPIGPWHG